MWGVLTSTGRSRTTPEHVQEGGRHSTASRLGWTRALATGVRRGPVGAGRRVSVFKRGEPVRADGRLPRTPAGFLHCSSSLPPRTCNPSQPLRGKAQLPRCRGHRAPTAGLYPSLGIQHSSWRVEFMKERVNARLNERAGSCRRKTDVGSECRSLVINSDRSHLCTPR